MCVGKGGMTRGGGKQKRSDSKEGEEFMEDELGLISDTSHHTWSLSPRTFQDIYLEFESGQPPAGAEEKEV